MIKGTCCPKFKDSLWDEKTFSWKDKTFIKETVRTFFHIPFPPSIGKKITKMMKLAEKAKKVESNKEKILILFTDPTPFKSEIYLSVTGKVPSSKNVKINGKFISKVFEGNYNSIPKFLKEMDNFLQKKKMKSKKYYIHYAYCPKCAKKYGKNKIVIFAKV